MAKKNKKTRPVVKPPSIERQTPRTTFGERQRPNVVVLPPPPPPKETP